MKCTTEPQTYSAYNAPLAINNVTSQKCEVCPRAATHLAQVSKRKMIKDRGCRFFKEEKTVMYEAFTEPRREAYANPQKMRSVVIYLYLPRLRTRQNSWRFQPMMMREKECKPLCSNNATVDVQIGVAVDDHLLHPSDDLIFHN